MNNPNISKRNVLIITLGTREIQFNKEKFSSNGIKIETNRLIFTDDPEDAFLCYANDTFKGFIIPCYPRLAGKLIIKNYERLKTIIEIPLIDKAVQEINKLNPIDEIILVYTDQLDLKATIDSFLIEDIFSIYSPLEIELYLIGKKEIINLLKPDVKERKNEEEIKIICKKIQNQLNNYCRDTYFYSEVIKRYLNHELLFDQIIDTKDIPINLKVTDIDIQYRDFNIKCKYLFDDKENISNVFLLPQGGIDQVNYALTLQLIQAFGIKVTLWQQAEGENPKSLRFPFLFLSDFEKAAIKELLAKFEFKGISIISSDSQIRYIAGLGDSLMTFQPKSIAKALKKYNNLISQDISSLREYIKPYSEENTFLILQLLYLSSKIYIKKKQANEVIWRLSTLAEMLLRPYIEQLLKIKIPFEKPPFPIFNARLHEVASQGLIKSIKEINVNESFIYPNKATFSKIYDYYYEQHKTGEKDAGLEEIQDKLTKLFEARNKLLHNALGWDFNLFQTYLKEKKISWGILENNLDNHYHVKPGSLGVFDFIINEIQERL